MKSATSTTRRRMLNWPSGSRYSPSSSVVSSSRMVRTRPPISTVTTSIVLALGSIASTTRLLLAWIPLPAVNATSPLSVKLPLLSAKVSATDTSSSSRWTLARGQVWPSNVALMAMRHSLRLAPASYKRERPSPAEGALRRGYFMASELVLERLRRKRLRLHLGGLLAQQPANLRRLIADGPGLHLDRL